MVTPKKKGAPAKKKSLPPQTTPKAKKAAPKKKEIKKEAKPKTNVVKSKTRPRIYEDPNMENLPASIDKDIVKVLQRNPNEAFVFWEISKTTFEKVLLSLNARAEDVHIKLLVSFKNAKVHMNEIKLPPFTNNWYLKFDFSAKNLSIEVCVVGPDGRFISILKSAFLNLPANSPSNEVDLDWLHEKWLSEGWMKNEEGIWKIRENLSRAREQYSFLGSSFGSSKHGN